MKSFRLADLIDFVFINVLLFLISFVWIKFFNKNLILATIISLIIVFGINLFLAFFRKKKRLKIKLSKKLENDIEQYMFTFLSNSCEENLNFFKETLSKKNKDVVINENLVVFKKENEGYFSALNPYFINSELKFEDCLKTLIFAQKNNIKKIIFLCINCNNKIKVNLTNLKNIEIKILEKQQIYTQILKKYNNYPKIKFEFKENKKLKFKQLLEISFNKSRAKSYFFSGLVIFFCSFIVRYNFYYVFMSSILFLFTILCFIRKNNPVEDLI